MRRATSSLPVPLSPRMRTGDVLNLAISTTRRRKVRQRGFSPTRLRVTTGASSSASTAPHLRKRAAIAEAVAAAPSSANTSAAPACRTSHPSLRAREAGSSATAMTRSVPPRLRSCSVASNSFVHAAKSTIPGPRVSRCARCRETPACCSSDRSVSLPIAAGEASSHQTSSGPDGVSALSIMNRPQVWLCYVVTQGTTSVTSQPRRGSAASESDGRVLAQKIGEQRIDFAGGDGEDAIGVVVAGDVDHVQFFRLVGGFVKRERVVVADQPIVLHVDQADRRVYVTNVIDRLQLRTAAEVPVEARTLERLRQRDVAVQCEWIDARRDLAEIGDGRNQEQ